MPDHTRNGMQCNEFDGLLADALDGILGGAELGRFQAHARICKACGPLFADAEAGRNWLKDLAEVEPPANLVANILASTTGVDTQRLRAHARASQRQVSWLEHVQATLFGYFEPIWATVRQPRFAMSFGMAFFALSVGLTVLGVKPADLRQISLRPTAIRHTYYSTQARVVRYYDNVRWVYEMQAAVRRIKRNVAPAEPGPSTQPHERKNDTTQQPEQKQERNYSQGETQLILACAPLGPSVFDLQNQDLSNYDPSNPDLPVVSVTTYRRFV
jgi:Putative zinc-finger